jgi:hypothetical protein
MRANRGLQRDRGIHSSPFRNKSGGEMPQIEDDDDQIV